VPLAPLLECLCFIRENIADLRAPPVVFGELVIEGGLRDPNRRGEPRGGGGTGNGQCLAIIRSSYVTDPVSALGVT